MFGLFNKCPVEGEKKRMVDVGWYFMNQEGSMVYSIPTRMSRNDIISQHAKSVSYCPGVLDYEARTFEVTCPFDLDIGIRINEQKQYDLVNLNGDKSAVRANHIRRVMSMSAQKEWRHPERPVIQIATPYLFLADEVCYVNQLPPYGSYRDPQWPGMVIGGRFPLHIWPRPLMWAFEWYDVRKPLQLRRGEPWFYLRFETEDPSRHVRLVEVDVPPDVKAYVDSISGITNYVKRTFSLFPEAQNRRPKKLVYPKNQG